MKNKQFYYLFLANFVILFTGWGLFPVLPLYASQFGATPSVAGLYLACIYASISAGTLLTSWLAERLTHKGLFVAAGALGVPALVLLGQATALWQVVLLTASVWFCGGIGTALVSVFTGLYADGKSRGKTFSLMFLAMPLAATAGGITVGQLVTWQGYPLMFAVLAVVWAAWPLASLFGMEDKRDVRSRPAAGAANPATPRLERTFYLVLLVALLSATALYISRMGTSLSMQTLNFSARAIASTSAVGGLATIPVSLLSGTLSDRLGRKGFMILGYLLAAGGALVLSNASQLWHFWLASALVFAARSANGPVASAYATDLLAPQALSSGLSWLNSMAWIAGVLGTASAGYLADVLGTASLYPIAAALGVTAATMLVLPRHKPQASLPAWLRRRGAHQTPVKLVCEECPV
jgi:MFS family permease